MEAAIFILAWIIGVYFIKIKMELNAFRKKAVEHKDIYVPSYNEMMRFNHWSLNLLKYVLNQIAEYKTEINYKKLYVANKKESEAVPAFAWSNSGKQNKTAINFESENEPEFRSAA